MCLVVQIMDYTAATDNDFADLKAALSEAVTLCTHVNEGVKQKENTEQLEWLQAHVTFTLLEEKLVFNSQTNFMGPRKLLHWGKFFKVRLLARKILIARVRETARAKIRGEGRIGLKQGKHCLG